MRTSLLVVGVVTFLGVLPLHAATLVLEGVDYSPGTGVFTYRYAVDNRSGPYPATLAAILVIPDDTRFLPIAGIDSTSPPGWYFSHLIGGEPPAFGNSVGWLNLNGAGLPSGAYLSGFTLVTRYPPKDTFWYVFSNGGSFQQSRAETGPTTGPNIAFGIPMFDRTAMVLLCITLGFVGAVALKA